MYIIGIDGGGTKTTFGLFDDTKLIDVIEKGTCHFLQVGYDGCAQVIKEGVDELIKKHCIHDALISIGIAGYGSDVTIRNSIENAIKDQLKDYDYHITSDVHIALLGALDGQEGIMVIAGTGSIAMALSNGELYRSGGWGYQLGDEGSGYWIGKELLRVFTHQADGRMKKDEIYDAIMEYFNLDQPYQIIAKISGLENQRSEIASLAKLCAKLSLNNEMCKKIIKEAAYHASTVAKALVCHYESQPVITYYGGVFKNELFEETFISSLKDYKVIKPKQSPIYGAYYLSKQKSK